MESKESKDNVAVAVIFTKRTLHMQTNTIPASQKVFSWKQCHLCNQNTLASVRLKHRKRYCCENACNFDSGFTCLPALGDMSIVFTCVTLPKESKESVIDAPQSGLKGLSQTLNKLLRCATTPSCATAPTWQRPLASLKSRSEGQRGLSNALTRM
jgi:hypothetical protein